jgi:hypothetical protein
MARKANGGSCDIPERWPTPGDCACRIHVRFAGRAVRSRMCWLLTGYGLGLFLAAQVGPVILLIVRSVLRGGRALAVGLAMACAVVVIDLGYAIIGLAGAGSLLSGSSLQLWFGLVSAAVLIGSVCGRFGSVGVLGRDSSLTTTWLFPRVRS